MAAFCQPGLWKALSVVDMTLALQNLPDGTGSMLDLCQISSVEMSTGLETRN